MENLIDLKVGDFITADALKVYRDTKGKAYNESDVLGKIYDLKYLKDESSQTAGVINMGVADTSVVYEVVKPYGQVLTNGLNDGFATAGSNTTIVDAFKDLEVDILKDKIVEVEVNGIKYYRKITGNTVNTITIPKLPGAYATCVFGSAGTAEVTAVVDDYGVTGNDYSVVVVLAPQAEYATCVFGSAGTAEVTAVVDDYGVAGNDYSVVVVLAPGNDASLSASFANDVITVTLGTDAEGLADDSKNTATLVANAVNDIVGFSATMTGTGGVVTTHVPVSFEGGVEADVALSASFADDVVTVILGTDAEGLADGSKNTATLVASAVNDIVGFSATMTGTGGVVTTHAPVSFEGGIDEVEVTHGSSYQIIKI